MAQNESIYVTNTEMKGGITRDRLDSNHSMEKC